MLKQEEESLGNRTLSGVTKVGETYSSEDKRPHGVDIPTEINISRFFTTAYFFTKIFKDIALYNEFPSLPDGL